MQLMPIDQLIGHKESKNHGFEISGYIINAPGSKYAKKMNK